MGGSLTIGSTVNPADSTVTWASSNDTIASVSDGVVTAKSAGSATITATATYGGQTASATCAITVYEPSIELDKSTDAVTVNNSTTLTATTIPATAEVTWTSNDEDIALVEDGVVSGVSTGTAVITASITIEGINYTDTCEVTVGTE